MAEGDGAAVHVGAVLGEPEFLLHRQELRGEGLVHVEEIDLVLLQAGALEGGLAGAFSAEADLHTEGGDVSLRAELSDEFQRIDAHVATEGLDLAKVLVPVDEGTFEGTVDAEMHPPGEDGRRRIVVDGTEVAYGAPDGNTYGAPSLHAEAYLGDDHVEILELDLPHLPTPVQRALDGHGRPGARPMTPVAPPPSANAAQAPRSGRSQAPAEHELRALLREHAGNIAAVGRALGKERMQVHRWLKHHDIDPEPYRS